MSYDLGAARAAGLSDRQIIDYLSESRDYDVSGALQAGLSGSYIEDADISLAMPEMAS